jgi:hypothetical protein
MLYTTFKSEIDHAFGEAKKQCDIHVSKIKEHFMDKVANGKGTVRNTAHWCS